VTCVAALLVVIGASALMVDTGTYLGERWGISTIVLGGVVLAAVTSLPNAVAGIYLASRGRGAATLSVALNSNTLNVVAGLLVPGVVLGLGRPSGQAILITIWYALLTVAVLAVAYRHHGLGRFTGALIIGAYAGFTGSVVAVGYSISAAGITAAVLGAASAALMAAGLIKRGQTASSG